jgi:alpha-ketoglutarate-dependent taurine dioxygenase
MTYVEIPPKAAMLHALEVPPPESGGNTYFANMLAAYEGLTIGRPNHRPLGACGAFAN